MERDKRLELISDKIRLGQPVGFAEAVEAIEYQEKLKLIKKKRKMNQKTLLI